MASGAKKTLVGVVGAATAALLVSVVPKFEGVVLRGYLDPVGIPTKCMGDTHDVVVGKRYSEAECRESLEAQLIAHAEPVLKCTPWLKGRTYQLGAAVSFAYSIGTGAYCGSTTARRFNAGDYRGACKAMNESDAGKPQWVTARGQVLPGLVKRRADERAICERGL
ncbi:lysozyme [Paraburkholderia eburnea]|uniref:Lysozyme n=1 Tax=Paraburkholderia eburnea TaxID=1189126 RepID=A0A2S4MIL7_9BURK|nr:lysozyme [Paraburkholderia eburnea]POR54572.1 lysozyme [Paraburkholderia eburnea]PRZ19787.1 lysozyme [Paraburkholderia eburnea]